MGDMLSSEIQRLLDNPIPYGAVSYLARATNVSTASVSGWRKGHSVPDPERWKAIERALEIPYGHLARARSGEADTSVLPFWRTAKHFGGFMRNTTTTDDDTIAATGTVTVTPEALALLDARVTTLEGHDVEALHQQVVALAKEVRRLQRQLGKLGAASVQEARQARRRAAGSPE